MPENLCPTSQKLSASASRLCIGSPRLSSPYTCPMDWNQVGSALWDWVPWLIGILCAVLAVLGWLRARRAEKRENSTYNASPWEDARHESGDLFTIRNGSSRDVIVTAVEADPVEKAGLLRFRIKFPYTVYGGDPLGVLVEERYTLSRPSVVIEWRFADDDRLRKNRRVLPSVTP